MSPAVTSSAATQPARPRAGFTIIEVVLAMGILVMGATAVLGMLTFGAAMTRTAQLRAAAASAVDAVSADLEQMLFPYVDGEVGPPVELTDREVPGVPEIVYSATAVPDPEDPRVYRVDVEMSWKSAGVKRSKRFSVLRMREITFGERLRREFVERGRPTRPEPPEAGGEGSE